MDDLTARVEGETRTLTALSRPGAGRNHHPSRSPSFQRGARLGRYIVLRTIGCGNMGNVFAAYDPELERRVAIKVLHSDLLVSEVREEGEARLRREARAIAQLAHPNVVSVFDIGTVGERLFVAMELIEGDTLREWMQAVPGTPRPWREVLAIFEQAGRGLAAAHRAALVHRDFKPGNVMLSKDGRVRILDFGLAQLEDREGMEGMTSGEVSHCPPPGEVPHCPPPGEVPLAEAPPGTTDPLTLVGRRLGTPVYMAPEQYAGGEVDARADQFSFCIAFYQALYDTLPFAGDSLTRFREHLARGEVREPPRKPSVPAWILPVLLRGLRPDPRERFTSMEELLGELRGASRRRRHRLRAAAAAGLLVLAVAAWPFVFSRESSLCRGAPRHLDGIWDGERKERLGSAFQATGLAFAGETWSRVEKALDRYTDNWVAQHTEACEATHLLGEQSAEMLDRRMACLSDRLQELRALTELLAQPDRSLVEKAIPIGHQLSTLEGCADRRTLAALSPLPADEATARRARQVRSDLAEVKVLYAAGKYQESLVKAETVVEEAAELSYPPLAGEARFWLGRILGRLGRFEPMRENLIEAARIAHSTSHHELLAEALLDLIVVTWLQGDTEKAEEWGHLAAGAIETLEDRDDLTARKIFYLGLVSLKAGRFEEAVERYESYLALGAELSPADKSTALNNLAMAHGRSGRLDRAQEYLVESIRLVESEFGPGHPQLASTTHNLGKLMQERGDLEEALDHFQRSVKLYEDSLGPRHPLSSYPLLGVGEVRIELGQAELAVETLERALREVYPGDVQVVADIRFHLGRALWTVGKDRSRALRLVRQARDESAALGEVKKGLLADAETWLEERREP